MRPIFFFIFLTPVLKSVHVDQKCGHKVPERESCSANCGMDFGRVDRKSGLTAETFYQQKFAKIAILEILRQNNTRPEYVVLWNLVTVFCMR